MSSRQITIALVAVLALAVAGCGGGTKDIAEVQACLEKAGMSVDPVEKGDEKVSEGVFATTDLSKGGDDLTLAVAAIVKSEETVDEFEQDTKEFSKSLSVGEQKLKIDSGTEGRYVWVVTGATKDDSVYDKARDCVQP